MATLIEETPLQTIRPWQPFTCEVAALRRLSPSFLRVTFASPSLRHFADNGYDQRFKLIFPAPDCGYDKLPVGDRWYSELLALPDSEQCRVRTYTVRHVRPEVGEVDVDMVLHEPHADSECPALRWALEAKPGDQMVLLGPDARYDGPHGGVDFRPPEHAELLLAGDETAMPAIASILDRLPITAYGSAFIEVPEAADALELEVPPEMEVHWLPREGADWGSRLIPAVTEAAAGLDIDGEREAVEDRDPDAELLWDAPEPAEACGAYVWVAAETSVVRTIRRTVRNDLGLPKECGAFMGYWRQGREIG